MHLFKKYTYGESFNNTALFTYALFATKQTLFFIVEFRRNYLKI